MEPLEIVKFKLGNYNIQWADQNIQFVLDEVDQFIKTYCQINSIPEEMVYIRANFVVDYIRYLTANDPTKEKDVEINVDPKVGALTYITSGAVSYGFASNSTGKNSIANAHTSDLDELLTNYKSQLNKFRRVVW